MRRLGRFLLLLIAWGALMAAVSGVVRRLRPSRGDSGSEEFERVAILNGDQFRSAAQPLRRGRVDIIMGGVDLDLREASLAPDASLHVFVKAGGLRVAVPATWRVDTNVQAMFGGVDSGPAAIDASTDAPTLTVTGTVIFGGLQIVRG